MTEPVRVSLRYRAFNPRTAKESAELAIANGGRSDASTDYFTVDADPANPLQLLEQLFTATNLQMGMLWQQVEAYLPPDRTHTSLSPSRTGSGDEITVVTNGQITRYRCESVGWSRLNPDGHQWQPLTPTPSN